MAYEKPERRSARSDKYQCIFLEFSCSHEMLEAFPTEDSITKRLAPFSYSDEVLDLEQELKEEFWKIVYTLLTPRQRDVIKLSSDGYTQTEIADMLGVNQSSITKSLNGNVDYKNGKRVYGGSKRRILKIVETNENIRRILRRISEIRELDV